MPKLSGATNKGRQLEAQAARLEEGRLAPLRLAHLPADEQDLLRTELLALLSGEIGDPDARAGDQ